jgi:hypothetical protein
MSGEKTAANFMETGKAMELAIVKALLPLGLYVYTVSSVLGSGLMKFEARPISTDDKQELEFLKEKGLIS